MNLPDPALKPILTAREAFELFPWPFGRSTFYKALAVGDIPSVTLAGRRYPRTAELIELFHLESAQGSENGNAPAHHNEGADLVLLRTGDPNRDPSYIQAPTGT